MVGQDGFCLLTKRLNRALFVAPDGDSGAHRRRSALAVANGRDERRDEARAALTFKYARTQREAAPASWKATQRSLVEFWISMSALTHPTHVAHKRGAQNS